LSTVRHNKQEAEYKKKRDFYHNSTIKGLTVVVQKAAIYKLFCIFIKASKACCHLNGIILVYGVWQIYWFAGVATGCIG
jgi:hypothetical protein